MAGQVELLPATSQRSEPLMRDYWAKYRARTYVTITTVQCVFVLVLYGALELLNVTQLGWVMFFVIASITAALLNAITIALIHVIGRPFRDLVQAVILVAGEPTSKTPPNPNEYDNNDGFKEILQTVYEMAAPHQLQPTSTEPIDDSVKTGLTTMQTGLVMMSPGGKIFYYNDHAPIRKNTNDEPVLDLLFPEEDGLDKWLSRQVRNKLTAERHWTRIANKLPGEKSRRIFDISASYHKNNPAETVLTFFDCTNIYTPEEDDLDFISFAAHELRGPITVIRGYLDVLSDELQPTLEQEQAELMQRLVVTTNRLSSYVNNILNASRYDRRHFKLRLTEQTTRHIYDMIADDMQLRASTQNRVLVVDIAEDLPTVAADANSVGEVMGNLIDNAIKYSNEGGLVHVTARAIPGFIEISVIDRGIGMPANIMPYLFHKFYRSHRSRETVAGTGIGLYISKAIVSSHGGTITARSVENEGTTFSFTLPIYDTVAQKLKNSNNSNASLIGHGSGWIRNHSLYRG